MAAAGLAGLAVNGGRARIIASPVLEKRDVDALVRGDAAKVDDILRTSLSRSVEELRTSLEKDTLSAVAWMVADGLLEFKVAIPDAELCGDFHDKFGVFVDALGDSVAFHGSPNDSAQAFRNYESISIFYSWEGEREQERVKSEILRFEKLWSGADPNVRVHHMPEAVRRDLVRLRDHTQRPCWIVPAAPDKWRHQGEALESFISHERGVLEMATGTGKTRTAISIIDRLLEDSQIDNAIVVAYGTDLLDQWHRELLHRSKLSVYREYASHRESLRFLNRSREAVLVLSRPKLATLLSKISSEVQRRCLLIFDEVHGMGSKSLVKALDRQLDGFRYKLGLSATPERAYDGDGNQFVEKSIGPVIYRFTLEEAIRRGILCEFDYISLNYEFSDEDRCAIRQAIRRYFARKATTASAPVEELYRDLARVRKLSSEKIAPFAEWAASNRQALRRSLIFVETADYGRLVQNVLMDLGVDYHTYYGDDDRRNLKRFADGALECLLTCRRISEGIDISSVGTIVLFATSRAKLETIQRLGRCLRTDPSDASKRALVIDFIRSDEPSQDEEGPESSADAERSDWFQKLSAASAEG